MVKLQIAAKKKYQNLRMTESTISLLEAEVKRTRKNKSAIVEEALLLVLKPKRKVKRLKVEGISD